MVINLLKMALCQSEICFVCDGKVWNKGICLSVERTCFTKTAFPTKISQLIGDAFMVVVSDNDKLCTRCTTLINKSDKLEVDLIEINKLIKGLLNIKYNLNVVEDNFDNTEGWNISKEDNDFEIFSCLENTSRSFGKLFKEGHYPLSDNKSKMSFNENLGFQQSTTHNESIKPESYNKYSNEPNGFNNSKKFDNNPKAQLKCEVPCEKLVEDGSASEKRNLIETQLICNKDSTESDHSQDVLFLKEVKNEKPLSDYNLNSSRVLSVKLSDGETIIKSNQSKVEETSKKCTSTAEDILLSHDYRPKKKSGGTRTRLFSKRQLESGRSNITKTRVVRKPLIKTKSVKKHVEIIPLRRLRPILPKVTHFSDVLTPLCIIEPKSDSNKIKHIVPSTKPKVSEIENKTLNISINCNVYKKTKENRLDENYQGELKISRHYSCKCCKRNFENVELLKCHEKEHSQDCNGFKCEFCNKDFKTRSGLNNHKPVHTGKFSFYCDFCGNGFMSRIGLEEHRSRHTKEQRYICDVCGKKFSFQSTYWIHRKWHDNPFPYKCNDCGRLFRHTSVLAIHKRKHTGERPYKCSYCSFTFAASNSLKRHLILHTKEYPFKCSVCKREFTTRFKYTDHLAKAHNISVERPPVQKKNYKMAIHDDVSENGNLGKSVIEECNDFNTKDTEHLIHNFPVELSENIVEIVLEPSSVVSAPSVMLSDGWLT